MYQNQKINKKCVICGAEMFAIKQQKYCCDECRRVGIKENQQKRKAKELCDIAKAAKAEGLSYGQYCLKHGLY